MTPWQTMSQSSGRKTKAMPLRQVTTRPPAGDTLWQMAAVISSVSSVWCGACVTLYAAVAGCFLLWIDCKLLSEGKKNSLGLCVSGWVGAEILLQIQTDGTVSNKSWAGPKFLFWLSLHHYSYPCFITTILLVAFSSLHRIPSFCHSCGNF